MKMFWMIKLLAIGMDGLSSMLLLVPMVLIFQKLTGRKAASLHTVFLLLYAGVLAGIFSVTGVPTCKSFQFDLSMNLIPMADILNSPKQYFLNVLMFVPVGFLLPVLWEKYSGRKYVLGFACFLTMFIEIAQAFTFRTTDIDDLLTNLLGAVLGHLAVTCLSRKLKVPLPICRDGEAAAPGGPWLLLFLVFLVNFFIQPYWSAFFWDSVLL